MVAAKRRMDHSDRWNKRSAFRFRGKEFSESSVTEYLRRQREDNFKRGALPPSPSPSIVADLEVFTPKSMQMTSLPTIHLEIERTLSTPLLESFVDYTTEPSLQDSTAQAFVPAIPGRVIDVTDSTTNKILSNATSVSPETDADDVIASREFHVTERDILPFASAQYRKFSIRSRPQSPLQMPHTLMGQEKAITIVGNLLPGLI